VLSLAWAATAIARVNTPIFILHSYSQEYPWTKRQHEGFMHGLGAAGPDMIAASVEYLDTKRVPYTAAYADSVGAHLARKYAGFAPRLIYVTDDNALSFALTHLSRIFPGVPVFFSGINDLSMRQRIDPRQVTGVFEQKEIGPNLDLMRQLAPEAHDILVVGDESETFKAIYNTLVVELARQPDIRARFLSSGRVEELMAALRGSRERFVFLTTLGAMKNAAGQLLTLSEIIAAVVQAGSFVIISMEDVYLYPGVLGGYMVSGSRQGAAAAGLAARYLAGTAIAAIKPVESGANEYIVDAGELARLGLALPPALAGKAKILNPAPSFYERNFQFIVLSLYAIALLFAASLAAFIATLMRKNRQIAAGAKDLQTRNAQIVEAKENLVLAQRIAGIGSWEWTPGTDIIIWSDGMNFILARDLSLPTPTFATLPRFYTTESWERLGVAVARTIETALPFELELEMMRADGTTVWTATRGEAVRGTDGAVVQLRGTVHDIDVRKRADTALRASEEKFAKAFRSSPMFVAISTAEDGRYIDVNQGALDVMGYSREEIIGHTAGEIRLWVRPDDRRRAIETLIEHGRIQGLETQLRKKSGESIFCEVWGEPIEIEGRQCVIWVTLDVNERTRATAALQRSEEFKDAVINQVSEGLCVYHAIAEPPNVAFTIWNARMTEITGYTLEQINRLGWYQALYPDPAIRAQAIERMARMREGDEALAEDWEITRADGRKRTLAISTKVLSGGGPPSPSVLTLIRDVTEHKRAEHALRSSEDRFRRSFHLSPDSININRIRDGMYVSVNRGFTQILGYTEDEVLGRTSIEFNIWDDPEDRIRMVEGLTKDGVVSNLEARFRAKDGSIVHGLMSAAAIEIENVPHSVNIVRDITELKRARAVRDSLETQLRESQKMEAIGTLAGGIAHDFNNIIATILGNTELARQDALANPVALESLAEIGKATTRARDLVQQILSFSRRQPFEREPTALAMIVEESAQQLRATMPEDLTFNVHYAADVPPVLANAAQIRRVLVNLATNAMQMMENSTGTIEIRLDTVILDAALAGLHPELGALLARHPGRTVRLALSDDGPGMDAATLERIFEPFFTTRPAGQGTGLGLSVVLGIVQMHEGAIVVDSRPDKGTTFTLYLPAHEARSAAPMSGGVGAEADAASRTGDGQHILYVDDDESLVFLVRRLLARRGFRVSGYIDQSEALAALRADPFGFDLAVADYNMPGMSGLDLAREVRTIRIDLPVIVASGFIDEKLRAEAPAAGVRELVFKAGTAEDLCDAFARLALTLRAGAPPS